MRYTPNQQQLITLWWKKNDPHNLIQEKERRIVEDYGYDPNQLSVFEQTDRMKRFLDDMGRFYKDQNRPEADFISRDQSSSIDLVRDVDNIKKSLNIKSKRYWPLVTPIYNKKNLKNMTSAVLKASYHRAKKYPWVKAALFNKEQELVDRLILLEENPVIAKQRINAALYELEEKRGPLAVSATIKFLMATKNLELAVSGSAPAMRSIESHRMTPKDNVSFAKEEDEPKGKTKK